MSFLIAGKEVSAPVVSKTTAAAPVVGRSITGGARTKTTVSNKGPTSFTDRITDDGVFDDKPPPASRSKAPWILGGLFLFGVGVAVVRSR